MKMYPLINSSISTKTHKNFTKSTGTGFIISKKGLIVTNWHVVDGASLIKIINPDNGKITKVSIKLKDKKNDLVILQAENFESLELGIQSIPYTLMTDYKSKLGEEVYTIGYPMSSIMGSKPKLSSGNISGLSGIEDDPRLFQISNPCQPGNSGGPLFNKKGMLVGIVVSSLNAKVMMEYFDIIPQNVNFAIKVEYLNTLINMLPEPLEDLSKIKTLDKLSFEEQIEKLSPLVVQIVAE